MYMHQACASDGQRRGSDPQELQLWIVQSYYVGVGNLTSVLYKCSWCSYVLNHQSKPILPFKPGLSPAWQTPSKLSCLTTESQGSAISVSSALGSVPSFLAFGYMDSEGRSQSPLFARQALYKNWAVSLAPGHLLIIKKKATINQQTTIIFKTEKRFKNQSRMLWDADIHIHYFTLVRRTQQRYSSSTETVF